MEFELIIFFIIILIVFCPLLYILEQENNINNYDISNAALLNNFITYSKSGIPCYYLVYKFENDTIKQFEVTAEQYYKTIQLDITKNEEGS